MCFKTKRLRVFLLPLVSLLWPGILKGQEFVFGAYNLQNYGVQPGATGQKSKPSTSRAAISAVIRAIGPDILGVCEVASKDALAELQTRLKVDGMDLSAVEFVDGPDPDRHLALLSRYPIVERHSSAQVTFELNGIPSVVRRGFLDVVIQINPAYALRVIGVHLKSKLSAPDGEALIRRMEAHLLRERISQLLRTAPETNLLVYGDFNETRDQPSVHSLIGDRENPESLRDLRPADERGECWTHHWRVSDVYSRIDFLMASRGLWPEILKQRSRIASPPMWSEASDHRLISTAIFPKNRKTEDSR